ncbi:hypothetical protein K402DRAFT_391692 [Aulographum hederae CBS 113979]|uniref:Uncharacterized protein n=1 Tax=Aulographum hederae CBS 113979 TaxID=1176131 RepID=A0A6G1H632_9PEZI|nr:hypothetical protein K402DRAFT_391692 [Aulographum hederae CBS 113979]
MISFQLTIDCDPAPTTVTTQDGPSCPWTMIVSPDDDEGEDGPEPTSETSPAPTMPPETTTTPCSPLEPPSYTNTNYGECSQSIFTNEVGKFTRCNCQWSADQSGEPTAKAYCSGVSVCPNQVECGTSDYPDWQCPIYNARMAATVDAASIPAAGAGAGAGAGATGPTVVTTAGATGAEVVGKSTTAWMPVQTEAPKKSERWSG